MANAVHLSEVCWPVFEFITNFARQVKHGSTPPPEQARYEALSALRDAEDLAREDPVSERAWQDRVKAMMVYLIDYKMVNSPWDGNEYWFDNRFETDLDVLPDHPEALGGEKFFDDCDGVQREYELAERRDRRDKDELAAQLNLYFVCLRLGFKGKFHDYPQELADYTRRLFTRLPAYGAARGKDLFPQTYEHNQELKVDYRLGMSLTLVLLIVATIVVGSLVTFRVSWKKAVGDLAMYADQVRQGIFFEAPKPEEAAKAKAPTAPRL